MTDNIRKLALAFLLTASICVQTVSAATVFRPVNLDAAKQAAKQEGKMLLIDFTASWCGPCHRMDADTWNNPEVQKWINDNAVAIQIDVDQERDNAQAFQIMVMPSIVAFNAKDQTREFDRHLGYMDAKDFMEWISALKRGETSLDVARHEMEKSAGKGGEAEVKARHKFASVLVEKQVFPEALDQYVWLWKNLPGQVPGSVGERVAAIGAEIERLMRFYPKAKIPFQELRDTAEKDHNLLDYVVLNEVLHDQKRTLEWFDKVKKEPGTAKELTDVNIVLERVLIMNQRWSDIPYLYPDPIAELKECATVADAVKAEFEKHGMRMPNDPFVKDAAILYAGLLAQKKDSAARKLAAEAIKMRDSEALKKQFVITALSAKQPRKDQRKWVLEDKELLGKLDAALKPVPKPKKGN